MIEKEDSVPKLSQYKRTFILCIIAFSLYVIGITFIIVNYNTPNGQGLLYIAPFAVIGMIFSYIGVSIGHTLKPQALQSIFKILIGFGFFLLFVSFLPIIGLFIFFSLGGW
ncbi:MAG: hypothetical protein ACFFFB_05775 [Candidatus Heimdallarchaeota archaeon]